MTDRDYTKKAREEIRAFAKSRQEKPSVKMVAAVNAHFRSIYPNEGQKSAENAVAWRTIEAQRMVIDLIQDLSSTELGKAEKALKTIAATFATVRCVGGDWRAYVTRDGRTAEQIIGFQTAKDFKLGRFSMAELIDKLYPNSIPSPRKKDDHIERRTKRRRK